MKRQGIRFGTPHVVVVSLLVSCLVSRVCVFAAGLPSVFRGLVVADSEQGVRVVNVDERSQAFQADLRPEDLIFQVDGRPVKTIDEFATMSQAMKGRAVRTILLILRNGQPRALTLHLYSYPILRAWEVSFIPDDEIRFAEAKAGVAYWSRMGRGFEVANQPERALEAWFNALHYDPANVELALHLCEGLSALGTQRLEAHRLAEAVEAFQRATTMLQHLFDHSLTDAQLQSVKRQLETTLRSLRRVRQESLVK